MCDLRPTRIRHGRGWLVSPPSPPYCWAMLVNGFTSVGGRTGDRAVAMMRRAEGHQSAESDAKSDA